MKKYCIPAFIAALLYSHTASARFRLNHEITLATIEENEQGYNEEDHQIAQNPRPVPQLVYRASITPPIQVYLNGGFRSNQVGSSDLSSYLHYHYDYLTNLVPPLSYTYASYSFPTGATQQSENLISEFQFDRHYLRSVQAFSSPGSDYFDYFNQIRNTSPFLPRTLFTATYSNPALALRDAFYYVNAYSSHFTYVPTIMTIYLYAIRPGTNFISVTDAYRHELETLRTAPGQQSAFDDLSRLNDFYTQEDQYLAIGDISSTQIAYVDEYYYNYRDRHYHYRDQDASGNINREINQYFRNTPPQLYETPYPLGTIPHDVAPLRSRESVSLYYSTSETSQEVSVVCPVPSSSNQVSPPPPPSPAMSRKKRSPPSLSEKKPSLLHQGGCHNSPQEDFEEIFKNQSIKLKLTDRNQKSVCLTSYNYYLSVHPDCDQTNSWLYTSAGQLISEVFDGENRQFYCMATPKDSQSATAQQPYFEICDLKKQEQTWILLKAPDESISFYSFAGESLVFEPQANSYVYLDKNKKSSYKIDNTEELDQKALHKPYLQSAINLRLNKLPEKVIYPTAGGYLRLKTPSSRGGDYQTYYNMHNNALFSNYTTFRGVYPQVCYASDLKKSSGSSWDYASNEYCSTATTKNFPPHLQLFFVFHDKKWKMHDIGGNTLRYFLPRDYFYVAGKNWFDNSGSSSEIESLSFKNGVPRYLSHDRKSTKSAFIEDFIVEDFLSDHLITPPPSHNHVKKALFIDADTNAK